MVAQILPKAQRLALVAQILRKAQRLLLLVLVVAVVVMVVAQIFRKAQRLVVVVAQILRDVQRLVAQVQVRVSNPVPEEDPEEAADRDPADHRHLREEQVPWELSLAYQRVGQQASAPA